MNTLNKNEYFTIGLATGLSIWAVVELWSYDISLADLGPLGFFILFAFLFLHVSLVLILGNWFLSIRDFYRELYTKIEKKLWN